MTTEEEHQRYMDSLRKAFENEGWTVTASSDGQTVELKPGAEVVAAESDRSDGWNVLEAPWLGEPSPWMVYHDRKRWRRMYVGDFRPRWLANFWAWLLDLLPWTRIKRVPSAFVAARERKGD